MTETAIFTESREYNHSETRQLLGEVRDFFQKRLRLIVPEWVTTEEGAPGEKEGEAVKAFRIEMEQAGAPVYQACNGYDDLEGVLDLFDQKLNELLDNLDDLLDKNGDLDDESRRSLECYASAVEKCSTVYGNQQKMRRAGFKELSTVDELRDELRLLFSEIIDRYIIRVLFDALYERVKNNAGRIYELVIYEVNTFLAEMGVYTKTISPGEPVDPEFMESTPDSAENFTDDYRKFDTIDEVYRYPYLFADGTKIVDGRGRIWRRRD